jgi:hypothetical protein
MYVLFILQNILFFFIIASLKAGYLQQVPCYGQIASLQLPY